MEDISQVDWGCLLQVTDVNQCQEMFDGILQELLDFHCPVKKIQVRRNYTPWMTAEIREEMAKLQVAKLVASRSLAVDDQ